MRSRDAEKASHVSYSCGKPLLFAISKLSMFKGRADNGVWRLGLERGSRGSGWHRPDLVQPKAWQLAPSSNGLKWEGQKPQKACLADMSRGLAPRNLCCDSRFAARMSGIINTSNRTSVSYGGLNLGQIKYIVNCTE
jgi:hypothetical protein